MSNYNCFSEKSADKLFLELLEQAIESNDVKKVEALISKNADLIHEKSEKRSSYPPLWMAASRGHLEIVKLLIKYGANVQEVRLDSGQIFSFSKRITILHYMGIKALPCDENHIKVGEVLVRHGACVNAQNAGDRKTESPFEYALAYGNIQWLKFLLNKGVVLSDESSTAIVDTVFFRSPTCSRINLLTVLLNHGLDVKSRSSDGDNLLLLLSKQAKPADDVVKIAEFLIDAGVPVDEVDRYDWTSLRHSFHRANSNLASFLVKSGADVNKTSDNQKSILYYAIQRNKKQFVDLLLTYGANINARSNCGRTALYYVIYNRNDREEILSLLLEKGADVSVVDVWGKTPFILFLDENSSGSYQDCVDRMIREFAKLSFESIPIAEADIEKIQANKKLREYFEKCLIELNKMTVTKFHSSYTYYSALKMSKNVIKKLENLTKNNEFVAEFNAYLGELNCYGKDLTSVLNLAMEARDNFNGVELRLKCVFGDYLPAIVIRILANQLTQEDLPME